MHKVRATIDTNIAPLGDLEARAAALSVEVTVVTVTDRELAAHSYARSLAALPRVLETAVWDESQFDSCVFADNNEVECFENVLKIISNGSFPKPTERENLSPRQRNQLRDAIIFFAHVRSRSQIFVTLDAKGFVRAGRKQKLESIYKTQIMTREEFMNYLASRAAI
jgi:hypothetical protein